MRTRLDSLLDSIYPRLAERPNLRLIEFGCGDGDGLCALRIRFPAPLIIGVDHDREALGGAARIKAGLRVLADVRALPFATRFDLIVIRHPDVDRSPLVWRSALENVPARLTAVGSLLVTCYSAPEFDTIRAWLGGIPTLRREPLPLDLTAADRVGRDRFAFICVLS